MELGKLIVLEGACDGIGKSTQYSILCERLEQEGYKVVKHHFPSYDTYQGEPVVRYLKGEFGNPSDLSPYFINAIYAVDRAVTWLKDLKEEYEAGSIIVLDRYTTSSFLYQAALVEDLEERKKFIDYIVEFEYHKLQIKEPDLTIFLHAPYDVITELRKKRTNAAGVINDTHERDPEYLKKVYENAMQVADYLSWDKVDCSSEDGMDSINNIHEKVYKMVSKVIKK